MPRLDGESLPQQELPLAPAQCLLQILTLSSRWAWGADGGVPPSSGDTRGAWGLVSIASLLLVPPGLSRDTVLGRPGANVTLTCQDKGPVNVTVSWQVEERGAAAVGGRSRRLAEGNALLLRRLRYEDSGRYSCYVGGRLLRSLRLLVEGGSAPGRGLPLQHRPVWRPPSPSVSMPCRAPRNSPGLLLPAEPRQRRPVRVAAAGKAVPRDAGDAVGEAEVSAVLAPTWGWDPMARDTGDFTVPPHRPFPLRRLGLPCAQCVPQPQPSHVPAGSWLRTPQSSSAATSPRHGSLFAG